MIISSLLDKITKSIEFFIQDRTTWRNHVLSLKNEVSALVKVDARAAAEKTAQKNADRMDNENDLRFNHERLKVMLERVCTSTVVQSIVSDVATLSKHELDKKYAENTIKYCLASCLLVTSGGSRPHCILRMTNREFAQAKQADDGTMIPKVKKHKVAGKWGAYNLPMIYPNLYEATRKFILYYRFFKSKLKLTQHHAVYKE